MQSGFLGPPPAPRPAEPPRPLEDRMAGDATADQVRAPRVNLTTADFYMGDVMGNGSFSYVVKAQRKGTSEWYALKIMDKKQLVREKKELYIKNERSILDRLTYDGVVRLCFTFQDTHSLYMGLELCEQGELFSQIKRKGKMPFQEAQFYAAEIVLILEYIHSEGVIHRDLKPENLLLGDDGHLKLCDFGSAKTIDASAANSQEGTGEEKRKSSFVGTAEYVSPEVLNSKPLTKSADLWALGCCIFQMIVGKPPFRAPTEYLTFQKVINNQRLEAPEDMDERATSLIDGLLAQVPEDRLGAGPEGYLALKAHPFFEGVDWENLRSTVAPTPAPPGDDEAEAEDSKLDLTDLSNEVGNIAPATSASRSSASASEEFSEAMWKPHMKDLEKPVFMSEVTKAPGTLGMSKQRLLVLTSKPRLIYINPADNVLKGEIPWSSDLVVEVKSPTKFDIKTPSRVYVLEANKPISREWESQINKKLLA